MTVLPTQFVKKYAPWSVSKADTAQQCPLKFRYAYVNKEGKGRTGTEAQVGIAIHRILELSLAGKSLEDACETVFCDPKEPLLTLERERVEMAIPAVSTFLRRMPTFIERHGGAKMLIEQRLATSFTGAPLKFFDNTGLLRGVMDVGLLFEKKPHLMVIDHKTGKNRGLSYYSWQFQSYALLGKVNYPHITHVIPAIHWVQDEYTDVGAPINVSDLEPLVRNVLEHLNEATEEAARDLDVGKKGRLCDWCDYKLICPIFNKTSGGSNNGGTNIEIGEKPS